MTAQPHTVADTPDDSAEFHQQIGTELSRNLHRYTNGRRRLVEVLVSSEHPMTLPEIVAADPELAQSSAYRNLDVLVRCGVIRRITTGGDHAHFELAEPLIKHHHHLICINCGMLRDIHLDTKVESQVDDNLSRLAAQFDFTPLHHSLDLYGLCTDC